MDVVGLASRLSGEVIQFAHAVAVACVHPAVIKFRVADRIDKDVVTLGHFDGVDEVMFAGIFFAVREHHQNLPAMVDIGHPLSRGVKDGIVERGAEVAVFYGAEFGAVAMALVETAQTIDDGGLVPGPITDQTEMVSKAKCEGAVAGE
jgi:hypothetical protein